MQKRTCRLEVRFTKDELYTLTRKSRKAGLTTASFVRNSVAKQQVLERPPVDLPPFIQSIRQLSAGQRQLLQAAKRRGLNIAELEEVIKETRALEQRIVAAYTNS